MNLFGPNLDLVLNSFFIYCQPIFRVHFTFSASDNHYSESKQTNEKVWPSSGKLMN